jgi:hypothetical protein
MGSPVCVHFSTTLSSVEFYEAEALQLFVWSNTHSAFTQLA